MTASSSVLPSWAQVQIVQYADEQGLVSSLQPTTSSTEPVPGATLDLSAEALALVGGQLTTSEAEMMIAGGQGNGLFSPATPTSTGDSAAAVPTDAYPLDGPTGWDDGSGFQTYTA